MQQFQKRIEIVEAEQFHGWTKSGDMGLGIEKAQDRYGHHTIFYIRGVDEKELEEYGWLKGIECGQPVAPGDWIIRDAVNGGLSVCKQSVFHKIYESVSQYKRPYKKRPVVAPEFDLVTEGYAKGKKKNG